MAYNSEKQDKSDARMEGRHRWSVGNLAFALAALGAVGLVYDRCIDGTEALGDIGKFSGGLIALSVIALMFAHWSKLFKR